MKRLMNLPALHVVGLVSMWLIAGGCRSEAKTEPLPSHVPIAGEVPKTEPSSTDPGPLPTRALEESRVENVASTIEELLLAIARSNLTFVRNGTSHTAAEASAHIRAKYEQARSAINTPEEFIAKAATRSSLSGKPYLVQFADGKTQPLGEWLTARLATIRAGR